MDVLRVGDSVIQLRFLPDGRRLLVRIESDDRALSYDVLTLPGGERVPLQLPRRCFGDWDNPRRGNAVAVHPSGEWCYVAWGGRLFAFHTADGTPRPAPADVKAHQVVLSPNGERLVAAYVGRGRASQHLYALTADAAGAAVVWDRAMPASFRHVAGFLSDGERFVTVEEQIRIRAFASGDEQAAVRYPAGHATQPQLSPDGRRLGVIGYGSMYVYDTAPLSKSRRLAGTNRGQSFGNFVSFAFHPDGRTLAVIHGGPTLLKVYDVATLRLTRMYRWKLGPLGCVAFSADGMLGAVGSRDGRILIWDVDP